MAPEQENALKAACETEKRIRACVPFYEAQALMTGEKGGAVAVNVRAADESIYYKDEGFKNTISAIGDLPIKLVK